jgi:hypothetical protein
MTVRQVRAERNVEVEGKLPRILTVLGISYITTTIFVKYNYEETDNCNELRTITVSAVPNGLLQKRYNPSFQDTIWVAGRNAPSRGEVFRVRLSFSRLKAKAAWRVQKISLSPDNFLWIDSILSGKTI